MATYSTRTVVTKRREWAVPADGPWGAHYHEIQKAIHAAVIQFRKDHDGSDGFQVVGVYLRFHAVDDEIVISYEIEESGDA